MIVLESSPSKSATHRAFILAAAARRACIVERPLFAADTWATLNGLRTLGYEWFAHAGDIEFTGSYTEPAYPVHIDCGNSGTTLRLLTALSAQFSFPVVLTGDDSLQRRPNAELLSALVQTGARVEARSACCPFTIEGPAKPGRWAMSARQSSQFVSGMMCLAALLGQGAEVFVAPPIVSSPYIQLTAQMLTSFGFANHFEFLESGGLHYSAQKSDVRGVSRWRVEGDWSSAAFPIVASVLVGKPVRFRGLDVQSAQADVRLIEILRSFGQTVTVDDESIVCTPDVICSPGRVDLGGCPDLFPALVVLATAANSPVSLRGCPQLAWKESNRIGAMASALERAGIQCSVYNDGLEVQPGVPRAAAINAQGDHRIKMACEVLSLAHGGPLRIDSDGVEAVSYPRFWSDMEKFR